MSEEFDVVNVNNAAEIVINHLQTIVHQVTVNIKSTTLTPAQLQDQRSMATSLIYQDVWDRLTVLLNLDADDLREKADIMEEQEDYEEDEDE